MKYNNNKGFSLLETLIYVSIFMLLVVALNTLVTQLSSLYKNRDTSYEINQQGIQIMQLINSKIRESREVVEPSFSNSSGTLVLTDKDSNTITISLINEILSIQIGSQSPIPLHNNQIKITGISFANQSHISTQGLIRYNLIVSDSDNIKSRNFYSSASLK